MYTLQDVQAQKHQLRRAVLSARPFKPLCVRLKVFYDCNLKCKMCNHWRARRETPVPSERFKEVVSELAELGTKKIHISGGEPMLGPQVPDIVQQAAVLGIKVTLTTNGTLIDKVKAKRLVEAGLRGVNVSIDSPVQKMHEKVWGVEGSFKATLKAVELFRRYRHKGKSSIRINTVVSRTNYQTLGGLPDMAHERGADGINLIPVDDHCGEILSMQKKYIALFNAEIAPKLAEPTLASG